MRFFKYRGRKVIKKFFLRTEKNIKKGYNIVPIELDIIKQSTTLKSSDKLIFEKIYKLCFVYKDCRGLTTASNVYLSEKTGFSIKTVKASLKRLKEVKLINTEIIEPYDSRNQSNTNNRYRLITVLGGSKKIAVYDYDKEII